MPACPLQSPITERARHKSVTLWAVSRTWVITRAQPDADADASALRAAGFEAVAVPCIERVALPWPAWPPTGRPRVVFVTSPFAGRQLVQAWPLDATVAALAPITSAKLREAGVPVAIEAEGGVVALARALEARGGPVDVLYPTSDVGLQQEEQAEALKILSTFAQVTRAAVYATRRPDGLQLPKGARYVFMSPSAVENALAGGDLSAEAVACIGQSTVRAFRALAAQPAPTQHSSFPAFLEALKGPA